MCGCVGACVGTCIWVGWVGESMAATRTATWVAAVRPHLMRRHVLTSVLLQLEHVVDGEFGAGAQGGRAGQQTFAPSLPDADALVGHRE